MNKTWKWTIGIASAILLTSLFVGMVLLPNGGYGMMGYGYGWHMPMMYAGFGMVFMWLTSLAILLLVGIGIAWLINNFKIPK